MQKTKRKLYALIVGIDDYPSCPLSGCVNDSKSIEKFITSDLVRQQCEVHVETLRNSEATKAAITDKFLNHLGQASKDDVAFFYFSGHGAQEHADMTIWREEGDKKLEGLVCFDSFSPTRQLLLGDKELRYLIHKVSGTASEKPHILTVFDCCHSGENTRGISDDKDTSISKRQFDTQARVSYIFPQRKWNQFCFHEAIAVEDLQTKTLNEVLPQGNYIQIAACQSDESAYETYITEDDWGRGGIFTFNLIKVLNRSNGAITYYDLKSRIQNYIKNQFQQRPNIYVKGDSNREIYKTFLGGDQASQPMYANVVFNEANQAWMMDMGSIHGVSRQAETLHVLVNGEERAANIVKVNPSDTQIQITGTEIEKHEYKAYIHPFKSAPIGVYISGDEFETEAKTALEKEIEARGKNINICETEECADYVVHLDKWYYSISLPFDASRPLVLPVAKDEEGAHNNIFDDLFHISQWEFAKLLHNSDRSSQLNADAIKVEFFDANTNALIEIDNDQVTMQLHENEDHDNIKIKLTNTSRRKLHVAALYLGVNFEVSPDLLETEVQLLEPDGFVWLSIPNSSKHHIPYFLDDCKAVFNWKEGETYFKFIMSTHPFSVRNLLLDPLPDPTELLDQELGGNRGLGNRRSRSANAEMWTTRLIDFNVPNPNYNKVSLAELEKNMQTGAAPFLAGLYLEEHKAFSNDFVLKEGITAIDGDERGFHTAMMHIANFVSRRIRMKRYKKALKANPNAIRVVSEGDSWFQYPHPKVKDVIDHLSRDYAICSLGAAGDELLNYYKKQEFLTRVASEKPQFLLLSGGGNDILGEEFEGFLSDEITPTDTFDKPEDMRYFMNTTFFEKLATLGDTYADIFKTMQEGFPDLHILVHGYDYIIPLEATDKGWIGRYMIAKGMARQVDRQALISQLMKTFNKMMAAKAADFPNVHYIDARNTVANDRWYDEIHPDSLGFADVAAKFKVVMEGLV